MATTNERLQDASIRHAILIQRHGNSLAAKLVSLLNSADKDILDKLAARLVAIEERGFDIGPKTTKRLQAMLEEVRALNTAIYGRLHDTLVDDLADLSVAESGFQRDALTRAIPVELATTLPAPEMLRAIVETAPMEGQLLVSWTQGMEAGRAGRIEQAIRLGLTQGESTDRIVGRIRGSKAARYEDGILQISRRSAQSIVRTATNHVSNVAAQATWQANHSIIKGWQYLATLDGRTTTTCAGLSGQVFPIGEGPIPPRHVNCRSISIPVTKSFKELGLDADETIPAQRASMDGKVAGDTTMKDWLLAKGEATQESILGKTRAELFRSGKLDLSHFIKNDGTVLTLEQLKAAYPGLLP